MDFMTWLKAALIRALKTFAQTAVAMLPAAAMITDVDWLVVLGTAALAAVASLLTSIAGLPELKAQAENEQLWAVLEGQVEDGEDNDFTNAVQSVLDE